MNRTKHEKTIDHFRTGGVLLVLPFIVLLAGCTKSETAYKQVKLEPEQLKQIKIGQTTQAQVESLLGKPTSTVKSHGQIKMDYYYDEPFKSGYSEVTTPHVPNGGVNRHVKLEKWGQTVWEQSVSNGTITTKSYWERRVFDDTKIIIGKDGKVADIRRVAFVEDGRLHPDFTKVDQIQPGITTQKQVEALLVAPPFMSLSMEGNTRECKMWHYDIKPFEYLNVYIGRDGIVDEVQKHFKGSRFFPKRVGADKIAQIKEQQSTRKTAESIFGSPSTISCNTQGSFYTYFIKVGKIEEEVYIEYDSSGVITRLIRKPLRE